MNVLLVEDDPLQRQVYANWLEARGHRLLLAGDGRSALRTLAQEPCDVVVLDWLLPDMTGQDVLQWIRARRLPIAVLFATSLGGEFEIASILELGADDYVVKPLRQMEFAARVEGLARRAARRRHAPDTIVHA